jgi:hypothetical protein
MSDTKLPQRSPSRGGNWIVLFISIIVAILFQLIGSSIAKSINEIGFLQSADDIVRMVTVQNWLAGQGWFDPVLPRLGYEPGTLMHWSRLVDAPLGLLVMVGNVISAGFGIQLAATAWPMMTFTAAFAAILFAVRRATGSSNVLPTIIVGGFSLLSWAAFVPGAIDHHNIQVAMALWLVVSILPSQNDTKSLALAGIFTSVSLAIGMETLPIAMAGAIAVCIRLFVEREAFYEPARRYGLALATSMAAMFFLLVAPEAYGRAYCDALSVFQFVCAGAGGLLLYAGLHPLIRKRIQSAYVVIPAFAGIFVVLLVYHSFPQCLADPVVVDPLMKHYWLDSIIEAQNVFQIAKNDSLQLIYIYSIPLIALGVLVWQIAKREDWLAASILLVFLFVTIAVTMFQLRGVKQAFPLAGLILSITMTRFMEGAGKERPVQAIAALLTCCSMFWGGLVGVLTPLVNQRSSVVDAGAGAPEKDLCRTQSDLATLSDEKPGFIAAANGLGPWLLFTTNHRVLAGPYHRNVQGNIDAVKIMIGSEPEARAIIEKGGITHFMACAKFADEAQILREVPNGFLGQLIAGKTPQWLEPIASTMDKDLKIWRVRF